MEKLLIDHTLTAPINMESDAEPELGSDTEPEHIVEPENNAEPVPKWPEAFHKWGNAWELHVYSFGAIFLIISFVALYSMAFYLRGCHHLKHGKTTFSLQCLLFLFSILRSFSLFLNPYMTSSQYSHITAVFTFIWAVALPGLTASFSLLLLVLLDTTKMTLGPPRFQNLYVILGITAGHFVVVMLADVLCVLTSFCRPMLMFCQALFILYGLILFIGYLYSAIKIYTSCKVGDRSGEEYAKIQRIYRVAIAASVTSFSIFSTYIYSASSEFGIYSDVINVEAWDWWVLQTVIRLEEIISCCIVLIVVVRNPLQSQCNRVKKKCAMSKRKIDPQENIQTVSVDPDQTVHTISMHTETQNMVLPFR